MALPNALTIHLWRQPQILFDSRPVATGSRKALALLLLLALDGPQTRERLAAWLWPDADPAAARRNLRRDLFRLREAGLDLDESDDGALRLRTAPVLDSGVAPAALLVGLDGLAGEEFDAWLGRARLDLEARRAQAQREQGRTLALAGQGDQAVQLWRGLVQANPADEPAALELAGLLRRQQRADEATAVLQQVAAALDELGLQPSAAWQAAMGTAPARPAAEPRPAWSPSRVAMAALAAAPSSESAGVAGSLPRRVPYVERPDVQAAVHQAWRGGRRVYLSGPPGMGKSRLAGELAAGQGAWLRLACEPNDALVPYASAVRALRTLREAAPDVDLPPWVTRELAQLLPELGPVVGVRDTDEARARLVSAYSAAFAALVHDNFQALAIDDWHWADDGSLELWAQTELPPGVVVLMAHRSAQLRPSALARQHAEVDAGRAARVRIEGFDDAQTLALVRGLSGSPGGAMFARRLRQATDGNPFFLLETLRHLFEQGLLLPDPQGGWRTPFDEQTADYAELPVPATVRDAVLARVRAVGEPALRLLEAASLLSVRFDLALLRGMAGGDDDTLLRTLTHAVAAQLLVDEGSGWRFAHDLVRQCLADALSGARRRLLHQRLAANLQAAAASPALVAHHHEAAADLPAARQAYRSAALAAQRLHAVDQALAFWSDALRCGASGADAVEAQLARALLYRRRADMPAELAALDAAAEAAQSAGLAERVEVQLARAERLAVDQGEESLKLLDGLGPLSAQLFPAQQRRLLELRARALMFLDRATEAQTLLNDAIAIAERAGDLAATATLLDTLARTHLRQGRVAAGREAAERAVGHLELLDDPAALSDSLNLLGVALLHGGRQAEARATLLRARERARIGGHVPAQRGAIFNLVKLATDAGLTDEAVRLLDEAEALSPTFEHARAEQAFREARYYVHFLRGERPAADRAAERLLQSVERVGGYNERIGAHLLVVDLYMLAGELERVGALLDQSQALCDEQQRQSEGGHHLMHQATRRAWWHLLRGEARAALDRLAPLWPHEPATLRLEDRASSAWIGCAAARRLGELDQAVAWLRRVDGLHPDLPTDHQVPWLIEALALAEPAGLERSALVARAQAICRLHLAPAQWLPALQAALG